MNRPHRLIPALVLSVLVPLQAGQGTLPALVGETASGRVVELPSTAQKRPVVLGIAYGKAARSLLEDWYEPAYLRFVAKHGLFASAIDADVYFVPLFVGANKAAYEPSLKKFRKSASPEIVDHVLFCKGETAPFRDQLGMKHGDIPYFFVLDAQGRVLHREEGAFSVKKLDALEEALP